MATEPADEEQSEATLEMEFGCGTKAQWVVPGDKVDQVTNAIEAILGIADSVRC